jgi:hypothetical protein
VHNLHTRPGIFLQTGRNPRSKNPLPADFCLQSLRDKFLGLRHCAHRAQLPIFAAGSFASSPVKVCVPRQFSFGLAIAPLLRTWQSRSSNISGTNRQGSYSNRISSLPTNTSKTTGEPTRQSPKRRSCSPSWRKLSKPIKNLHFPIRRAKNVCSVKRRHGCGARRPIVFSRS